MMIFLGSLIVVVLTILIVSLNNYLKRNNLKLNIKFIIYVIITIHLIYSIIGILFSPEYTKPNGNVCTGFNYGINVCSGYINVE